MEFKPFMTPHDPKETEFIHTVVAFANTYGGRIYVGADDEGVPLGEAELRRCFHAEIEAAVQAQVTRLRALTREQIKPVPPATVKAIQLHDHPLILVEVKEGQQKPYATHGNDVYVRRGATNRRADPHSDLPALLGRSGFTWQ